MLKKGFLASNIIFLSIAHTRKIIDNYLLNLEIILKMTKKNKDFKLMGKICHSTFKRLT